jgi:predicted lipoprotein with Yx(FWY)xxD motif
VRIKAAGPAAVLGLGTLLLTACGGGYGTGTASSGSGSSSGAAGSSASSTDLKTTNTAFGSIVINAKGRTVYAFNKDTKGSGASACSGACAGLWPAVTVTGPTPSVKGVTGKVGTIKRDDGSTQVTLDGRPLYTYSGDSGAGDTTGQGVQGVWWVVAPDGAEVTSSPAPSGY